MTRLYSAVAAENHLDIGSAVSPLKTDASEWQPALFYLGAEFTEDF